MNIGISVNIGKIGKNGLKGHIRHIGHTRRIFHIGEIVIVDMFVLLVELMIANSMAIFVLLDTLDLSVKMGK